MNAGNPTAGRATIAGLVVAAAGIAVVYVSGGQMPVVPPGFVLLVVAAALLAFTRWRWTPIPAVAVAVFEAIGSAVATANLVDVDPAGIVAGTWIRLVGSAVAVVAGIVAAVTAYRRTPAAH